MLLLAGVWPLPCSNAGEMAAPWFICPLIINFTYTYFGSPVISLDWGNFEERIVSNYVRLVAKQNPWCTGKVLVSQITIFGHIWCLRI